MSAQNRANLIAKIHKVLKKHYKPVTAPHERTVLEHLLYGCCLENSPPEDADEAFARIQQSFFDWNEMRVTTVAELAESMNNLPEPTAAAGNLKRVLQAVFEAHFAFDLEFLRKQNLGKSEKDLERYTANNPFLISYVVQNALGGHSIPCCRGTLEALVVVGAATQSEADKRHVAGMERAIPKNKGGEFASLLHQLGADVVKAPTSTRVRQILLEIEPDAKDRLPKRKKDDEPQVKPAAEVKKPVVAPPAPSTPSRKGGHHEAKPEAKSEAKSETPRKREERPDAARASGAAEKRHAPAEEKKAGVKRLAKKKPR